MSNKPDGRKYNGGVRAGAGRPPKPEEIKMLEKLTADNFTDEAIAVLQDKVRGGNAVKGKEFAYVYDVESKNLKQVMVKGMKKRYISSFEKPISELYKDEENKATLSAYVRRMEIKNILS